MEIHLNIFLISVFLIQRWIGDFVDHQIIILKIVQCIVVIGFHFISMVFVVDFIDGHAERIGGAHFSWFFLRD